MTKVSVVVTVLNEAEHISLLLTSLFTQSLKPNEVIIVDAGSTDQTGQIVRSFQKKYRNLTFLFKSGNRSVGRNYGIEKSKNNLFAISDAGCIPKSDWLEKIVAPIITNQAKYVAGFYQGRHKNIFQKCLIPYVLVMPDKAGAGFLASTRSVAMLKDVWKQVGKFDEHLDYSEDYEFSKRVHSQNIPTQFVKQAVVDWLPRDNISQSAEMFYNFAKGDVIANTFRPKVFLLFARYILFLFLALAYFQFFLAVMFLYFAWAIQKNYHYVNHSQALFWLPLLQLTSDFSVMTGSLIGTANKLTLKSRL